MDIPITVPVNVKDDCIDKVNILVLNAGFDRQRFDT